MKSLIRGAAALLTLTTLGVFASAPARAQEPLKAAQFTIKGGLFRPSTGGPKDVGQNWLRFGAEYDFGNSNAQKVNSLELLYTSRSDEREENGFEIGSARYRLYTLMLNHKMRQANQDGVDLGNVLFYGGGLGLHFARAQFDASDGQPGSFNENRTMAGANLFVGMELAANFQVEAKYQFGFGKLAGDRIDGLDLLVGFRF